MGLNGMERHTTWEDIPLHKWAPVYNYTASPTNPY